MKIRTFGDFTILGVLLPALRGKYIFEKRTQKEQLKKISSFLSNQITARGMSMATAMVLACIS